jgi:hypothetical protein
MNQRVLKILTVAAVCGPIAVAAGLFLTGYGQSILIHNPGGPHETLCLESSQLNSSTNMSLNLVNCGNYPATPLSYYVQDSAGNTYADPNWSAPTIPLNTHVTLNILIDGKAFTFQHGSGYTIELNTSRAHYTYTITA